jgi:ubiquinone biosynthesis protein
VRLAGTSLKTKHLTRYKDVAALIWKYGRSDIVNSAGLQEVFSDVRGSEVSSASNGAGAELAADLEKLGATFIKLGQVLFSRQDLLPPPVIQGLTRLQDKIEPFSFDQVEAIVQTELGVRISKAFDYFEAEPIAAASLGQVHRARLRDGRMVAVKVQRPGVKEQVLEDTEVMAELVEVLEKYSDVIRRHAVKDMVAEFRATILMELDYLQEARNVATLQENLSQFQRIIIPRAIDDYTTSRVLAMEYVQGAKVTSLSPLARVEVEGSLIAEELFYAYLKQILVDGFFHADPHPGNVFISDNGKKVALLDLGMVARISPAMQEKLLQLLFAMSEGNSDETTQIALKIGDTVEGYDAAVLRQRVKTLVDAMMNTSVQTLGVGCLIMQVTTASVECGVRLPAELTMLGKTLLHLDEIAATLNPDFDPNEFIRKHSMELMSMRMKETAHAGGLFRGLLETKDFVEHLPRRLNQIMDRVAENDLSIRVDAIDEIRLISGIEKIANRITLGLVLAALIVGAAMLMSVPTTFRIFGYPGLAMIFFLAAAAGGLLLVVNILANDARQKR